MVIDPVAYRPPWWLRNRHLSTVIPSTYRKVRGVRYDRERIETGDDDFMDLDWLQGGNGDLAVLVHGLEGSSSRPYILGMARYLFQNRWDVLAWNCRSCSGEMNRQLRMYHHGATDDLETVINHVLDHQGYSRIALVGFSMGGSIITKYLGERETIPGVIKGAAMASVPFQLKSSAIELEKPYNGFYRKRFLRKLRAKIRAKAKLFPELLSTEGLDRIKVFTEFDEAYTAPIHGFKSADDFYLKCSAARYLPRVRLPLLIVNADNDPFLPEDCYPRTAASKMDNVRLEIPALGGHVGFSLAGRSYTWFEKRTADFFNEVLG